MGLVEQSITSMVPRVCFEIEIGLIAAMEASKQRSVEDHTLSKKTPQRYRMAKVECSKIVKALRKTEPPMASKPNAAMSSAKCRLAVKASCSFGCSAVSMDPSAVTRNAPGTPWWL
jgi:hypothetical protein